MHFTLYFYSRSLGTTHCCMHMSIIHYHSRTQSVAPYQTQILPPQLYTTHLQNLLETREVYSLENVTLWSLLDAVLSQNRNVVYHLAGESAPCVEEMNN